MDIVRVAVCIIANWQVIVLYIQGALEAVRQIDSVGAMSLIRMILYKMTKLS